jgi:prophage regulatory protein
MSRTKIKVQDPSPDVQTATFLRLPTVLSLTGLGRSTIYRMIAEDKFPHPVLLAARAVAWRRTDLEKWSELRQPVTH